MSQDKSREPSPKQGAQAQTQAARMAPLQFRIPACRFSLATLASGWYNAGIGRGGTSEARWT